MKSLSLTYSDNPKKQTIDRYKELDAFRGIAALIVVFFHFTMGRSESLLGFKLGVTGADFFFIISGFVIFMSLSKISSSLEFLINRFIRLYPVYWICVTLTFSMQILANFFLRQHNNINISVYLKNMTMLQYYFKVPDIDGPYWTLIIEMIFYVIIVFLYKIKQIKNITIIGFFSIFVVLINDIFFEKYIPGLKNVHVAFPFINHLPLFFSGILFFKIINSKNLIKNRIYYELIILCFITQIFLFNDGGRSRSFINIYEYTFMILMFFLSFIFFVNGRMKFVINQVTLFLGKISFPLYLIHQYLSREILIPVLQNKFGFTFWLSTLVSLFVVVMIANLISKNIEFKLNKKIKFFLNNFFIYLKSKINLFETLFISKINYVKKIK